MASKIKVDQIQTADGTGTIALQNQLSGMTSASMPAGSTLQVVQHFHNSTSSYTSTTSTSYVTTNLTKTITPSSTSSKIKIEFSGFLDIGTTGGYGFLTVKRGSTNLGDCERDGFAGIDLVSNSRFLGNVSYTYLDSPATTSATTYEVFIKAGNSATVRFRNDVVPATLVLTEIKG